MIHVVLWVQIILITIWKDHKTGITLFIGSVLTIIYGIIQIILVIRGGWNGYNSVQDTIEQTSQFVPVDAAVVTFIAGVIDMSLWFSDNERKRMKEKIEKQTREAEAIYPLAFLVATDFVEEYDTTYLAEMTDNQLLEEVKEFGADKALDIAAQQAGKDILEFIASIQHNVQDNQIVCRVSDMLVQDDFAAQVVKLVKTHLYADIQ